MGSNGKCSNVGFVEHLVLSSSVAVAMKTIPAPIERVKLLIQNQSEIVKLGRLSKPYRGVIDCVVKTYRSDGLRAFWRGNLTACINYFPSQGLSFAFNEKIKKSIKTTANESYSSRLGKNILCGSTAGMLTISVTYSLDFVRQRLATDVLSNGKRQYRGIVDVYKKTLKSDGIVGLYRGFVIACVGIVAYRGLYFGLYETLKPILLTDSSGILVSYMLGYGVTVTAGLLSYPFDTIRRRMMMRSGEREKYKGSVDCVKVVIKNEGFTSLYRGAAVSILRGVFGAGSLTGFDFLRKVYISVREEFSVSD